MAMGKSSVYLLFNPFFKFWDNALIGIRKRMADMLQLNNMM